MKINPTSRTISTGDAAKRCAVTRDTILKWIKKGILDATRTPGGHYRVYEVSLRPYLAGEIPCPASTTETPPTDAKESVPCWEFMSPSGVVNEACQECLVYRAKALRCFEMARLGENNGFRGTFCKTSCVECSYFNTVHGQLNTNSILVLTEDVHLIGSLTKGLHGSPRILRFTSSTYECSALIDSFKPGIILVDFELHQVQIENLCQRISEDPRIPDTKIIAVTPSRMDADHLKICNRAICASLEKPITLMDLENCIMTLEGKVN
ncbi:MAG: excisionase family DNA-binding protein [Planctomycetota bacterium]|jgi:excisionase family DNA binding protein